MTIIDYTETFLPELGYLVAERGDPQLLNHAAGLSSYFERDDVLRCGRDVYATRGANEALTATVDVIAASQVTFTIKSEALPNLTTMYFPAEIGVAEVSLVAEQTFVTVHPSGSPVVALLQRHVAGDPASALIVRRGVDGSRCELAISGTRHAYREAEINWRAGEDAETAGALQRFVG